MNISIKLRKKTSYSYYFASNINELGKILSTLVSSRILVVSDKNVNSLYQEQIRTILQNYKNTNSIIINPGEEGKTQESMRTILQALIHNDFTREDTIIAIGGGSVSDVAGFCASIYKRGINYIILPTTLLSAVDACIGGKTAINYGGIKNQIGSFYQPSSIVFCKELLAHLPQKEFQSAYAEIIKYGIIKDKSIFAKLDKAIETNDFSNVIQKCVRVKSSIIKADELDHSNRQLLNLGHLIGHALESSSGFELTHGQAIAIGTLAEARALLKLNLLNPKVYNQILKIYEHFGFTLNAHLENRNLQNFITADKHIGKDYFAVVLIEKIGRARICKMPINKLNDFIEYSKAPLTHL